MSRNGLSPPHFLSAAVPQQPSRPTADEEPPEQSERPERKLIQRTRPLGTDFGAPLNRENITLDHGAHLQLLIAADKKEEQQSSSSSCK